MEQPRFDKEKYNFLKPDLKGPLAYYKQLLAERDIKQAETRIAAIKASGPVGKELQDAIENEIAVDVKNRPSGKAREELAKAIFTEFRSAIAKRNDYGALIAKQDIFSAIYHLKNLYFAFDVNSFRKDFEQAFVNDLVDEPIVKELEELRASIEEYKKSVMPKTDSWLTYMKRVPNQWHGLVVGAGFSRGDMAEAIIKGFISDWQQRCRLFTEPVTIYGTSIASLPERLRKIWLNAYETMNLHTIPKSPRYYALPSMLDRGDDIDTEVLDALPEFFKPQRRSRSKQAV